MLVVSVSLLVARYLRYDVAMLVAVNPATKRTFPAIAVCNMCPMRRDDGKLH